MEQRKRRLPPLKSLIFLESVVRTGSVTAAADELSITHSAISKQLSQLEAWVGTPLFVEKRKGMIPTAEIARIADLLGNIFDDIQDAFDGVRPARVPAAIVRVIAPATFAMRWLIPKLPEFHTPQQSVDTMVRPTHTNDNWLDMPFDVAIRRGGIIPVQFSPQDLFSETLSLVVSARLFAEKGAVPRERMSEFGLLDVATRPGELKAWLKAAGLPGSLARQASKPPHFYIGLDTMFAGRGALVVPTFLVEDQLLRGEIIEPFPEIRVDGPLYQIFTNPTSREPDKATAFVDWIRSSVPAQRKPGSDEKTRPQKEWAGQPA
ncbi:LysR family transcriptional regulator [Terrihabitans sp. B22-R8]|uniref:LysR family transcriptional regulator n=1 Tax=Terrihabitans sp. B22-R8 TaxID=3425128 RepID=UPI00403D1DB7